ncbi:hypothetical protein ASG40_04825 [Methylobacterium sp. Leaf399]|uniref:DUF6352 family protein n=1 Tax=Methylobacterium sp. Leaf399 TaxID=1736364 RepID=UPI0006FAF6A5|nr:DUF6352 family protein [Methylobacterium sp. Leaf399]KQT14644.1 hypothetical protein ASG40_04825 [Methylobacterium sp. Leaf399]
MTEFWVSSGHHLAGRTEGGGLAVTDELLLAYLARPELLPPEEACEAERDLHARLMEAPRLAVPPRAVAAMADADARENWEMMLAFRDRLLAARSVEAAYLDLVRNGLRGTPPIFLNQLVHLILRNALDGCEDPYVLRAAELFFRPQKVSLHEGRVLLADAEVIEARESTNAASPLVAMLGKEPANELDVMVDDNAWTYWSRSDAFTMALDLGTNPRSRDGLARAIEAWIGHLLHAGVTVSPIPTMEDADWRWFVGLDAEATRIGNALWNGQALDAETGRRVLALFSLVFEDAARVAPQVGDRPVYLILAMGGDGRLTLKPQNLVAGLPLIQPAEVL